MICHPSRVGDVPGSTEVSSMMGQAAKRPPTVMGGMAMGMMTIIIVRLCCHLRLTFVGVFKQNCTSFAFGGHS